MQTDVAGNGQSESSRHHLGLTSMLDAEQGEEGGECRRRPAEACYEGERIEEVDGRYRSWLPDAVGSRGCEEKGSGGCT